jgi:hypothetical protein
MARQSHPAVFREAVWGQEPPGRFAVAWVAEVVESGSDTSVASVRERPFPTRWSGGCDGSPPFRSTL